VIRLVALQHDDPAVMLRALDAVWADGDAALPLPAHAREEDTARVVTTLAPHEVRTDRGTHHPDRAHRVDAGTALVVATSGTTGPPRGIVLSHAALAAATTRSRTRLGAADGVPWLGVLPLHHVAGIGVVLRSRAAGVEPLLHRRDTPAVLDAAPPAWISLVPVQLRRLLAAGVDLARHHGVLLGGAAAAPALLARAAAAGVHVVTSYGATETCGGCVYDGRPLDDVDVAVADDGRIRLRTPTIATGVRGRDGTTRPVVDETGWWTTNDLGEYGDDGRLQVLGRADDVVVSGGENVPLGPVRAALVTVPGLAASSVVGLPDDEWGTAVTAVVVPLDEAPDLETVRTLLAARLPRTHLPTRLVVARELPVTGLGKVTAGSVMAALADGRAGRPA
jgi:O-succinylbenzoic acid--CoA ligase